MTASEMSTDTARRNGQAKLVLAVAAMALIWGVLLPALARHPTISAHLDHLDEKHVDASALYYTDLDRRVFAAGQ